MRQKELPANSPSPSGAISLKLIAFLTSAILLVILSAVVFTLYRGIEERNRVQKTIDAEIGQTLKNTNEELDKFFDDINSTLILLSSIPQVKNDQGEECYKYLRTFLRNHTQYVNFGVADDAGDVICSAVPPQKLVNLSDRTYFLEAKDKLTFAPGLYRINKITKTPTVSFGYPVVVGGKVNRVVFASVGIDWFEKLIANNTTREDMTITIFDKNGTVLARNPGFGEWAGTPAANKPLVETAMTNTQGPAEVEGLDKVKRYYKFLPLLYGTGDSGYYLTIGASKKESVQQVDEVFVRKISLLALASIAILAINITMTLFNKQSLFFLRQKLHLHR